MPLYLTALILSTLPILGGWRIASEQYMTLLSMIVGVSGAIFTIMGIWIAHLYPNIITALKEPTIINADFSTGKKDSKKLKVIIGVIITSSLNMAASVTIAIFYSILGSLPQRAQEISNWIIQSAITTITLTQLFAIISVILVCTEFVRTINSITNSRRHDNDA